MRVLSIDGGGIRGLIPALVLAEVEQRTGKRIAELFDLVAGTSTGGILACALTRPDAQPAADVVGLYRTEGPRIFRRSPWQRVRTADGLLGAKHDDRALNAALGRYLGTGPLSEATTRVLVTSYDLQAREPFFFKSWREDRDAPRTDAARATAAAPTYFTPWPVGPRALVDGGVFATNPAMCAYAEVSRLTGAPPELVLSLGTGSQTKPITQRQAAGWGLVQWVRPVIDVVFDGVADTVGYELDHLMDSGDVVRLQTTLDRASDALDDASARNLALLEAQAVELIARETAALDHICARLLRPRQPPAPASAGG
jgi:uncharacterized protein